MLFFSFLLKVSQWFPRFTGQRRIPIFSLMSIGHPRALPFSGDLQVVAEKGLLPGPVGVHVVDDLVLLVWVGVEVVAEAPLRPVPPAVHPVLVLVQHDLLDEVRLGRRAGGDAGGLGAGAGGHFRACAEESAAEARAEGVAENAAEDVDNAWKD